MGKGIELTQFVLDPVFPVLFDFYDDHPIGKLSIKNTSAVPLEGVKVSLFVNQYMDTPKLSATIPRIEPGSEVNADLFALFNNKLLEISEGTKVAAKISVDYSVSGSLQTRNRSRRFGYTTAMRACGTTIEKPPRS